MPYIDQNLQVTPLFCWHPEKDGRQQGSPVFDAIGKSALSSTMHLAPQMVFKVLSSQSSRKFCSVLLHILAVLTKPTV